ncbi:Peroxidase 72 [Bienertia sinuspersici]
MAQFIMSYCIVVALLALAPICFSNKMQAKGGHLNPHYYDHSCPQLQHIVKSVVAQAIARERRMAASLLRLHFHDCFVKGCDASVLLDNNGSIVSEKDSKPNKNSLRGFEVIDQIKAQVEKACPQTVSCADIVAVAARDSTVIAGGPNWEVPLGRRDARGASIQGSNNDIPAANQTFNTILTKFKRHHLDLVDLVALSGAHTIGNARCVSFRQRLYNQNNNGQPDMTLDQLYASKLRSQCPRSGGDQNLFSLDFVTPFNFDNNYYRNILANKGLLSSDQILLTNNHASMQLVKQYAQNVQLFFDHFAKSMVKMGNISPLTGSKGEIRQNCRRINSY